MSISKSRWAEENERLCYRGCRVRIGQVDDCAKFSDPVMMSYIAKDYWKEEEEEEEKRCSLFHQKQEHHLAITIIVIVIGKINNNNNKKKKLLRLCQ